MSRGPKSTYAVRLLLLCVPPQYTAGCGCGWPCGGRCHRLPRADPVTNLLNVSTFPCKKSQYRWIKVRRDAEECPNLTILCVMLRLTGPVSEKTLCMNLLGLQCLTSAIAFYLRYWLFDIPVN